MSPASPSPSSDGRGPGAPEPSDPDYGFRGESIFTWSLDERASLVAYADDGSLVQRIVVREGRR